VERFWLAPRLLPSRLEEPGRRKAEADRLGDGGADGEAIATVLGEAYKRQVEEVTDILQDGPEGLYKTPPY